MSVSKPTDEDLAKARHNLTDFVRSRAEQTAAELGFGWLGTALAPSTYQQLRGAFEHSKQTGEPLPVSSLYCENTVYLTPGDNVRFRFFHDVHHVRLGVSFALEDEWELALWHLADLERAGYSEESLEYRLLQADVIGQIIIVGIAGRFPWNQGTFTRTCAELGLDTGIFREMRRVA
jgi:hypothetical protein